MKRFSLVGLHHALERNTGLLIFGILVVASIGGLVQVLPTVVDGSLGAPTAGLEPYPALELVGRDVYIRESCSTCHSQQVRPLLAEARRRSGGAIAPLDAYRESGYRAAMIAERGSESVATGL